MNLRPICNVKIYKMYCTDYRLPIPVSYIVDMAFLRGLLTVMCYVIGVSLGQGFIFEDDDFTRYTKYTVLTTDFLFLCFIL